MYCTLYIYYIYVICIMYYTYNALYLFAILYIAPSDTYFGD